MVLVLLDGGNTVLGRPLYFKTSALFMPPLRCLMSYFERRVILAIQDTSALVFVKFSNVEHTRRTQDRRCWEIAMARAEK